MVSADDDRPVRWGLVMPQGWHSEYPLSMDPKDKVEFMIQVAKDAEKAGFDSIWTIDHLEPIPDPSLPHPVFECWTSLSAIARETKTIRLGQAVTCICFRNPALLAKMAATVDVLSHGRLELGLGAGWYAQEFKAYGYDFAEPKVRLRRLREGVEIIKQLWASDKVTYNGKHYRVEDAHSYPKPIQKPYPPITIGGSGEKVTLRIVAEHANRSNFQDLPPIYAKKLDVLKKHCEAIGRDFNSIEKSYLRNFIVGKTQSDAEKKMKKAFLPGDTMENFKLFNTWGDPSTIIEHFREYRKLGVSYMMVYLPNIVDDSDAIQLFSDEVIPGVK
ncbi:MAG: LLM class F420-dependent oxidoreductase [Candidatus Ranarchaeia archaeon]